MFVNLPPKKQAKILGLKINEIDLSKDYSEKDKAQMMSFYKKKLKIIYPQITI